MCKTSIRDEIMALEEYTFGMAGNCDVEAFHKELLEDEDYVRFLDDIARNSGKMIYAPETPYHRIERVKELLDMNKGKLPVEAYPEEGDMRSEENYFLERDVFFHYGGTPEEWYEQRVAHDPELLIAHHSL